MSAYELAAALYDMSIHGEDGTISAYGEALPSEGYYVGGKCESLVFKSTAEIDRGELAWWIGSNSARWYGVWVDSADGRVYFDAVTRTETRNLALILGKVRGEIAVWDIANGVEIRVNKDSLDQ